MQEKSSRPGWVSAIATWYFGWSAVNIVFVCLVYSNAIQLTASHRARLDAFLAHVNVGNLLVWALMLAGAGFLFRLRRSALYLFAGAFVGNCLIALWLLRKHGWEGGQEIITLAFALGVPLIICLYSKNLVSKGVLK